MKFRTIWIVSAVIVAIGVIGSCALWAFVPWSSAVARNTGLVSAGLGIVSAIPYLKASRLDEYVRASLIFLLWLFLAIGFALRTMMTGG